MIPCNWQLGGFVGLGAARRFILKKLGLVRLVGLIFVCAFTLLEEIYM